ncbi:O-antigen ligase family protein [Candidatus Pelagibacter communis]|uniref:O-antigen ligase family protein n=1 Tax=Pelagibacter ubique TaxID=198252 RepID=UPI00065B438D|nr:O-antigen ligase family protein [Candidatus Pelagibacter ubique]
MYKINSNFDLLKYIKYSVFLIPFFLISGPFLAEITIFLCCLYYISVVLKKKKINFYNNKFNFGFFIFFISIIISSLFSKEFETSILKSLFYFRFFLFFYFVNTFFNDNDYRIFNLSVVLAVVFVVSDIFVQFIFGKDIFGYEPGMNGLRYQGPFGDEWVSGSYLKNFGIISVAFLFYYFKKNQIKISNLLIIFSLIAILLSGEKMALILFILFIVMFFFVNKSFVSLSIYLSLFVIVSTMIFLKDVNFDSKTSKIDKLVYRYNQQFLSVIGVSNKSNKVIFDTIHGVHFLTGYEIFKKYKFFGSGIKTYRIECSNIKPETIEKYGVSKGRAIDNRCTSHPHNFLIEILSETGAIGLFGYLIFLFTILKNFNWNFTNNSTYNIPYFFSFIFFIFPFATSGSFFNNYNSIIFWIILSFMFLKNKKINF